MPPANAPKASHNPKVAGLNPPRYSRKARSGGPFSYAKSFEPRDISGWPGQDGWPA
jgi:hypothetical protein